MKLVLYAVCWKEDGDMVDPQWIFRTREEAQEVIDDCYGRGVIVELFKKESFEQEERK
jgi:hypothetical protein